MKTKRRSGFVFIVGDCKSLPSAEWIRQTDSAILKLTLAEVHVLAELRKDGSSDTVIAANLKCSVRAVHHHLKSAGEKLFKRQPVSRVQLGIWAANNLWPPLWMRP